MRVERPVTCEVAAAAVAAVAGDGAEAPADVRAHVATCLRCQAEVSRYRRTLRDLRALHGDWRVPPAGAVARTLEALGDHQSGPRRPAVVGGVVATAGAAAGVAGMLVWRSRRRVLAG